MNESTQVPREEMSDLDWLARNVHMWVHGQEYTYVMKDQDENRSVSVFAYHSFYSKFSRDQWLARRAELQNKPSWADAPEWAEHLVQNSFGLWTFAECEPKTNRFGEWTYSPATKHQPWNSGGEILGDWRDTLEKRTETNEMPSHRNQPKPSNDIPECSEVKQFEPFASVEDAKITIMQSDGDVKNFGGIIGRSLPLEEDAATAKQPVPKGSGNPILGMVLADLTNRALEGKEKYGEPLLANNGRNPLWDAYQEALDLAMYLRQAIEEQK